MFENIGFKFDDLVSKGLPPGSSSLSNIFGDIYEQYPDRYNFYINLLESISSSNPNAVYELFKKENLTRNQRTKINEYVKDIKTYFANNRDALQDINANVLDATDIRVVYKTVPLGDIINFKENDYVEPTGGGNAKKSPPAAGNEKLIYEELGEILNQSVSGFTMIANESKEAKAERTKAKNLMIQRKKTLLSLKRLNDRLKNNVTTSTKGFKLGSVTPENLKAVQSGGASLEEFAQRYLNMSSNATPDAINAEDKFTLSKSPPNKVTGMKEGYITDDMKEAFLADPIYGPEPEKVLMTDRVIFVVATYIIRAIALFMVEWGVHTNFINTFMKGFAMYFGVYMCIFFLLVILTNAQEDEYIFRMLFFYINTQSEGGRGIVRLVLHTLCVVMLIPIPFIVRDLREFEKDTMTFSEKRTILSGIEKFTLYAWILTSVVALKV